MPPVDGKRNFQSFTMICRKSIWLAQFICAPQFFKTPKGLCGYTVFFFLGHVNCVYVFPVFTSVSLP
jgi:hypothetical protein